MKKHRGFKRSLLTALAGALIALAGATVAAAAPPANTTAADDHRHAQGGRDADRAERHVDEQSDVVPVPVAALRRRRRRLRGHFRRGREDLSSDPGRREPDAARSGPRRERRRLQHGAVRADGGHRAEHGAAEHCPPDDHGRRPRRRGADCGGRHLDEHPDLLRLRVAALRHRRHHAASRLPVRPGRPTASAPPISASGCGSPSPHGTRAAPARRPRRSRASSRRRFRSRTSGRR